VYTVTAYGFIDKSFFLELLPKEKKVQWGFHATRKTESDGVFNM
jgi:hypothetical protein